MSMLTALASAYGGYGQGKLEQQKLAQQKAAQDAQNAQAQQDYQLRQQQAAIEQQRVTQENLTSQANLGAMGLDKDGNPLPAYTPPALTTPGKPTSAPVPPGWHAPMQKPPDIPGTPQPVAQPTPEQYYAAGAQALASGRPDAQTLSEKYRQLGDSAALATNRLATAGVSTARVGLLQAQAQYDKARATYISGKNGVDMARIRASVQNATGAQQARVQAAQIAAQSRVSTTTLSDGAKIDAVTLAGYFALQNRDAQTAAQMAIAQAGDAEKYAASYVAKTSVDPTGYDPSTPIAAAPAGGTTVNVSPTIQIRLPSGKLLDIPNPAANPAAKGGAPSTLDPVAQTRAALKAGHSIADIVKHGRTSIPPASDDTIRDMLVQAGADPKKVDAAMQHSLFGIPIPPIHLPQIYK